jgi:GT2 family glycosyltransferase
MEASVVICAYTMDRWDLLVRAAESVLAQDVEASLVLVIDHNEALLARARDRWPHVDVRPNASERGLSGARNTGVRAADTPVVAFLDDDAVAEEGWLRELCAPFASSEVGLTSGWVVPEWAQGQPGWFPDEFLWVVGCSYKGLPERPTVVRNPIGASMAIRREVLATVGLFHAGVGRIGRNTGGCEETELAIRARDRGWVTAFVPASVVRHHVPIDRHHFTYFVRRCWSEGRAKAVVARLAGPGHALESERSYVTTALRRGVIDHVAGRRSTRLRGTIAIMTGVVVTGASYVLARATGLGGESLPPAPQLECDSPAIR